MAKFNIPAQTIPTVASAYADVIGTTDNQIVEIKNELIIEDNKQKFKIHEDTIDQLAERIAKDGQLSPCIVAPLPNGKYELIDGRHRRRAVIKAGLPTTKCIIKSDFSSKILIMDSLTILGTGTEGFPIEKSKTLSLPSFCFKILPSSNNSLMIDLSSPNFFVHSFNIN